MTVDMNYLSGVTTTGTFFVESHFWVVGGFDYRLDLNETASSPALLKINNIYVTGQYVGIYDPTGTATITDYALDINNFVVGGEQIAAGDIFATVGQISYIDVSRYNGGAGITNDDAITLSEWSTGFIVDRVEYGAILTEPENTIMNNAPNPVAGTSEIHRQPADGSDTNDCLVDFVLGPPLGGDPTATITGVAPASVSNDNTPDITYDHLDSPASVDFYWSDDGGASWNLWDTDAAPTGPPDTFTITVARADGTYHFSACPTGGNPTDPIPSGVGDIEFGPYTIDTVAPTINPSTGFANSASPSSASTPASRTSPANPSETRPTLPATPMQSAALPGPSRCTEAIRFTRRWA